MYPRILLAVMLMGNVGWLAAQGPGGVPGPGQLLKAPPPSAADGQKAKKKQNVTVITPREKTPPPASTNANADVNALLNGSAKPAEAKPMDETEKPQTQSAKTEPAEKVIPQTPANLPQRGISKENVKSKFGDPQQVIQATGIPPIERWVYDSFTVYFERDNVIHTVAHRSE